MHEFSAGLADKQNNVRALIVDDHPLFLDGLRSAISRLYPDWQILTASNGADGLSIADDLSPSVIISDISMPKLSGMEMFESLFRDGFSGVGIIVTSYIEVDYMEHAFDLGVTGYMLKDSGEEEINECVNTCLNGNRYVSPRFFSDENGSASRLSDNERLLQRLTMTEKRVLRLLSQFKTNKQIARELDISFRTVQNHRYNITHKLELNGVHQLLQYAVNIRILLTP